LGLGEMEGHRKFTGPSRSAVEMGR